MQRDISRVRTLGRVIMIADPHGTAKLSNSRYGNPYDLDHIKQCFDKTTKLSFKDPGQVAFVRFGTTRDNDPSLDIRFGQLKISGWVASSDGCRCRFITHRNSPRADVAAFFEPSIVAIQQAIQEQKASARVRVTVPIFRSYGPTLQLIPTSVRIVCSSGWRLCCQ